jgi:hypothetical protein
MSVPSRRTETRTPVQIAVNISDLSSTAPAIQGITQNVSPGGARVLIHRPWEPGARLGVKTPRGGMDANARVAYCQSIGYRMFAIGLELFGSHGDWTAPKSSSGSEDPEPPNFPEAA